MTLEFKLVESEKVLYVGGDPISLNETYESAETYDIEDNDHVLILKYKEIPHSGIDEPSANEDGSKIREYLENRSLEKLVETSPSFPPGKQPKTVIPHLSLFGNRDIIEIKIEK